MMKRLRLFNTQVDQASRQVAERLIERQRYIAGLCNKWFGKFSPAKQRRLVVSMLCIPGAYCLYLIIQAFT